MRSPFAVRNGAALNSGSSAIRRSFATRLPEKSDRLRSPSFTLRPRMIVSCRSIPGRNVFAFTKRGIKATATTSRPINASRIFVGSFRVPPPASRSISLAGNLKGHAQTDRSAMPAASRPDYRVILSASRMEGASGYSADTACRRLQKKRSDHVLQIE